MPCACFCAVGAGCKKNTKKQRDLNKIVIFALQIVQDILCFAFSFK
jgi:hypothetical protein